VVEKKRQEFLINTAKKVGIWFVLIGVGIISKDNYQSEKYH